MDATGEILRLARDTAQISLRYTSLNVLVVDVGAYALLALDVSARVGALCGADGVATRLSAMSSHGRHVVTLTDLGLMLAQVLLLLHKVRRDGLLRLSLLRLGRAARGGLAAFVVHAAGGPLLNGIITTESLGLQNLLDVLRLVERIVLRCRYPLA